MKKTLVTINEAGKIQNVILAGSTSEDVIDALLGSSEDEISVVKRFIERTGLALFFDTPTSSNITRISFFPTFNEICFTFDNDSEARYPSTFEKFLDARNAPSAGQLQWAYRRGEI